MSHTDVIEKNRIEKLWFSFKNWFICFFPHELTCMGSYHLLLKFPPIKHTIFFTKRQCVTSSEIWVTGQTKHRGLGGGPVCFFERDAIFLECSKANFDEFWKIFDIKFWCHTLTHGTVLRRLAPNFGHCPNLRWPLPLLGRYGRKKFGRSDLARTPPLPIPKFGHFDKKSLK